MSIYQRYFDKLNTKAENSGTETPNWLIKIALSANASSGGVATEGSNAVTRSLIPGFLDFCPLLSHRFAMDRQIEKSVAEHTKPDGGLFADNLQIVTRASFLNADFNNHFHQNNCLEIELVRIKTLNSETPIEAERYSFIECYMTKILVEDDFISASFRYSKFSRSVQSHKPDGGNEGATSATYNFVESSRNNSGA